MRKPIILRMTFTGGKDSIIQPGAVETMTVEIFDGMALFHFNHMKHTRAFAISECKDGVKSRYIERMQKCASKYPGMKQEQILEHIKTRLLALGAKGSGMKEKWPTNNQ